MEYIKYTINTTTSAAEYICFMLSELGITALEIEDNIPVRTDDIEGSAKELLPNLTGAYDTCRIIFYRESHDETLIRSINNVLSDISIDQKLEKAVLESERITDDYLDNWKKYFHVFWIGDLLIKPSWEASEKAKKELIIDPGVTFGTGAHESTKLCIMALQQALSGGEEVLDIGFGSGILAMVSLIYGAKHVTGTDIDPICADVAYDNFEVNNLARSKATLITGDIITDHELRDRIGHGHYDIITANILADIIIDMSAIMYDALKDGGICIASGIIDFKSSSVTASLTEVGFTILEVLRQGEWVGVVAKKDGKV